MGIDVSLRVALGVGMNRSGDQGRRVPTQVRQVRQALKREFGNLIDLTDIARKSNEEREQILLSRALAALVVRHLTGCSSKAAAAAVTDGRADNGIDAIAMIEPHLWLVQTKWSDTGSAKVTQADIRSIVSGVRLLDEGSIDRFNARVQRHADSARGILCKPEGRVTLLIAAMRDDPLSAEVECELRDEEARLNSLGEVFDHQLFHSGDLWKIVQRDIVQPPVELTARMKNWTRVTEPYEAFSGPVPVAEVAQWYSDHGDLLFSKNIRMSLGLTQVNAGIRQTLLGDPQSFWYLNNGITVLCDAIQPNYWSRIRNAPVELRLQGASVVNGAQTVVVSHQAMLQAPETVGDGMVEVRAISLAGCPPDFASSITKATNTQNRVEPRDFVALDPVQTQIGDDFRLTLEKSYVVRRGEPIPPAEGGCSVEEAALALACAHANPEYSARAKKPDLLWERGSQGAYDRLFYGPPSAYRIWRSILLVRQVRLSLQTWRRSREGRMAAIAEQGEFLIAHIVIRQVGLAEIDNPDAFWLGEDAARVTELAIESMARVAAHVDAAYGTGAYIGSTFASPGRCRELSDRVLADIENGVTVAEFSKIQPETLKVSHRRPNAVPVLVDAGRLPDGTQLEFGAVTKAERTAMAKWLAESASRASATWVNERAKPLLWAVDGKQYSPSGLVAHMWNLAGWKGHPIAVQGPSRWVVPGEGSLWELALAVLRERESSD